MGLWTKKASRNKGGDYVTKCVQRETSPISKLDNSCILNQKKDDSYNDLFTQKPTKINLDSDGLLDRS